jgi:viologen exporter family transport system permease protein
VVDRLATLTTYRRLATASMRARAQYRLTFGLDFAAQLVAGVSEFLAILVIFHHLPRLGGWSLPEVAFLYGLAGISFALTDALIGQLDSLGQMIRMGTFDVFLVRPLSGLLQVATSDMQLKRLTKAVQAGAVLTFAIANLHIAWSAGKLVMFAAAIGSGAAIFSGVWVAGSAIGFWTTDIQEVVNSFTYGGNYLTSYPINIFGAWTRRFLAFVVPMAFVAYYPSLFILGKPDAVIGVPALAFVTPLIAVLTLSVGLGVWRAGVRHYRSTGS